MPNVCTHLIFGARVAEAVGKPLEALGEFYLLGCLIINLSTGQGLNNLGRLRAQLVKKLVLTLADLINAS